VLYAMMDARSVARGRAFDVGYAAARSHSVIELVVDTLRYARQDCCRTTPYPQPLGANRAFVLLTVE